MKTSYEWFKEKAGLTNAEAFEFFDFKFKQLGIYNEEKEPVDMEFIERISKEARKWKKNLY